MEKLLFKIRTSMPRVVLINQPVPPGNLNVIQAFFDSATNLLFQHLPTHPNINCDIRVHYGTGKLHTRYGGSSSAGYDIDLDVGNDLWNQHVYQFAHEACHVLANHQQKTHGNQWFEESVCEAASLYVLKTLAAMGANGQGPCVNLWSGSQPYHQTLDQYAENYIQDPARLYNGEALQQWFQQNETTLRADPYCRHLHNILANKLLVKLMVSPLSWGAIEFLNVRPCVAGKDSLSRYLCNWRTAAPSQHHEFIEGIMDMLM
jgi:hypothetical protein